MIELIFTFIFWFVVASVFFAAIRAIVEQSIDKKLKERDERDKENK